MRILSLALTFAGTLIGAGFISGKEIASFFGTASVFSIAIACVCIGGFDYVFMRLGAVYDGDTALALLGKRKYVAVYATRFAGFLTTSVMIAGGEYVLYSLFEIHGGGVITALLATPFAYGSTKGVGLLNSISVPFALCVVVFASIKTGNAVPIDGRVYLVKPLLYGALNVLTSGTIVAKLSRNLTRKQAVCSAILASAIMFLLILSIKTAIIGRERSEMPLIDVLTGMRLKALGGVLVYVSVFTTAVSALKIASDTKGMRPITTVASSLVFSLLGFGNLIDYAYPFVGAIGVVYGALAVFRLCKHKFTSKLTLAPLQGNTNV